MTHDMKNNTEVVQGIGTQLDLEELGQHRKAIAAYIFAVLKIMTSLPDNDYQSTMLTTVKLIESLNAAADYYVVYTKAMQLK